MVVLLSLAVGIVVVPTWSFWLWFMLYRPEQWAVFVDRENAFWVGRGLASNRFTGVLSRLEKGPVLKFLVVAGIFTGLLLVGAAEW